MADPKTVAAIRARVRELGDAQTLEAYDGALLAYVPLHEREPYRGLSVTRDLAYGNDPRQRLDVFAVPLRDELVPVMVFVHGGGFVRGDKRMPDAPYYDNAGVWAARHRFAGVTLNYRLAPEHVWPAGADDIAAMLAWVVQHAKEFNGDPNRVFVMGHSAGAAHVASYIARRDAGTSPAYPLRGAILISGIYDLAIAELAAGTLAYFGDDAEIRISRSSLHGIAATQTPMLVVNAEFDADEFLAQRRALAIAADAAGGRAIDFLTLGGHGHLSEVAHINADDGALSDAVLAFVKRHR